MISFGLMAIGGLNWLLVGAAGFNLVTTLFGEGTTLTRVVYLLVGLATVLEIFTHKRNCSACSAG